jgi:hypothetical protein
MNKKEKELLELAYQIQKKTLELHAGLGVIDRFMKECHWLSEDLSSQIAEMLFTAQKCRAAEILAMLDGNEAEINNAIEDVDIKLVVLKLDETLRRGIQAYYDISKEYAEKQKAAIAK